MKPRRSGCRRSCRGQRGAALLLFLIVFLTVGLAMLFRDKPTPESLRFAQNERTEQALMQAKAALIGYAARYRDLPGNASEIPGYLLCPDFDNDGFAEANCGAQDETVIGRLPYKTMGLPDLRDASGECLWYVVSGSHKNSPKSAAPMNWDSRGHLRIDDLAGNVLAAPDDANGGVVMAIIAPGTAAVGQNRPGGGSGPCSGDNNNTVADYLDSPWDSANEIRIVADRYQQAKASSTAAPVRLIAGQRDSGTNNDGVVWVTARELFAPIAKRSDLLGANAATNLMARLKLCLDAQATLPVPATDPAAASTAFASMTAIRLGDAVFPVANANYPRSIPPPPVCSWSNEFDNLWAAWRDHIRYVACTAASGRCLTVNGQTCKGALIFTGARADGGPRTAAERNPAVVDTGNVADRKTFLDGPNWSSFTTGTTNYSGGLTYDPKAPAGDIVLGLQCFNSVTTNTDPGFADLSATAVSFPSNLTMVRLDSATRTLTLGSENLQASAAHPAASLFGCAWFGSPIPFGNGIRAFFKYVVREKGNGFVLTLADAAVDRNPGTTMCGAAGMHLGYSGTGGKATPTDPATAIVNGVAVAPIGYPKIGLEIDLRQHDNFSEPIDLEDSGRNDLTGTPHAAIVFWGHHDNNAGPPAVTAPGWDDNVHGLPATGNVQAPYISPQNPPFSNQTTGIDGLRVRSFLEEEGSDHPKYVRLEIDRSAITGGHHYVIRVWLSGGNRNSLDDLTRSYTTINPTTAPDLTTTRDIFKVPGASTDALSNIRVGFTNAAGDDDQEIDITEFTLRGVD